MPERVCRFSSRSNAAPAAAAAADGRRDREPARGQAAQLLLPGDLTPRSEGSGGAEARARTRGALALLPRCRRGGDAGRGARKMPEQRRSARTAVRARGLAEEGRRLYDKGQLAPRRDKLYASLKLDPENPEPHRTLGRIFNREDDVDKVRYHLQRYLDLGGADGDFKVREWLKSPSEIMIRTRQRRTPPSTSSSTATALAALLPPLKFASKGNVARIAGFEQLVDGAVKKARGRVDDSLLDEVLAISSWIRSRRCRREKRARRVVARDHRRPVVHDFGRRKRTRTWQQRRALDHVAVRQRHRPRTRRRIERRGLHDRRRFSPCRAPTKTVVSIARIADLEAGSARGRQPDCGRCRAPSVGGRGRRFEVAARRRERPPCAWCSSIFACRNAETFSAAEPGDRVGRGAGVRVALQMVHPRASGRRAPRRARRRSTRVPRGRRLASTRVRASRARRPRARAEEGIAIPCRSVRAAGVRSPLGRRVRELHAPNDDVDGERSAPSSSADHRAIADSRSKSCSFWEPRSRYADVQATSILLPRFRRQGERERVAAASGCRHERAEESHRRDRRRSRRTRADGAPAPRRRRCWQDCRCGRRVFDGSARRFSGRVHGANRATR